LRAFPSARRWNIKYLARRVSATIWQPRIWRANARALGVAIVRCQRTVAPTIVRPMSWGRKSRTVVSTSGSSGIILVAFRRA
jgi:hypothetical protein